MPTWTVWWMADELFTRLSYTSRRVKPTRRVEPSKFRHAVPVTGRGTVGGFDEMDAVSKPTTALHFPFLGGLKFWAMIRMSGLLAGAGLGGEVELKQKSPPYA